VYHFRHVEKLKMIYFAYLHSVMKYVIYFGVTVQIVKGFLNYGSKV